MEIEPFLLGGACFENIGMESGRSKPRRNRPTSWARKTSSLFPQTIGISKMSTTRL